MAEKRRGTFRTWFRRIWFTAVAIFMVWLGWSMQARGIGGALDDTSHVDVTEGDGLISFVPSSPSHTVFLFFPGALVDPKAYAPITKHLAETGREAHIVKMPWRMATQGYESILEQFDLADTSRVFVLAGHSQGGKMAAQFVYEHPGLIDALVLLGTSHPRDINLSTIDIPVMKILASNDGLASVAEVEANKSMLPPHAEYIRIDGGNHAQFGFYGFQIGDSRASISRDEQQAQVRAALERFMSGL